VHVLIVAEGATSRSVTGDRLEFKDQLSQRGQRASSKRVAGSTNLELLGFSTIAWTASIADVVKVISISREIEPHTVYTHWPFDLNMITE